MCVGDQGGSKPCMEGEFRCEQTGQCIDMLHVCDNYLDCVDRSDEGDICRE